VWDYIARNDVPYNPLHDRGYDSIGCAPCTVAGLGRDGRWAGTGKIECGIHV
jgi:phosphoadenosine phosphosulfate reductase